MDHRQRGERRRRAAKATGLHQLRLGALWIQRHRVRRVQRLTMLLSRVLRGLFACRRGALLRSARSLLASRILFGKALLSRFCLPVVVAHAPSIHNHSAAKLSKHALRRHDGNLP